MSRREFIILLGGALVAWPLAGEAQQPGPTRRVGVLMNFSENDPETQRLVRAFREEMGALGWADGRNLKVDYRLSGGDVGRVRAFAKELVGLSPDDHTRKKLFDHKEEVEPVAMALRELCSHNAKNINVETHGVGDAIPATTEGFAVPRNRLVQNPEGAPSPRSSFETTSE